MDVHKELRDVQEQSELVLDLINQALKKIDSAKNWGLYDTFAGGMFSSFIKRDRMRESNQLMEDIDSALQKLQKEYGEMELQLPSSFNLDFTSEVLDVWLDNIFTDLSVQSDLKRRREQLVELFYQVDELNELVSNELNKQ